MQRSVWLGLAVVVMVASTASAQQRGAWSAPSDGLRGRLVATARTGTFEVAIELENVGATPVAIVAGDPFALSPALRDASGREVPPTSARMEVMASPRWIVVAPGSRERVAVSIRSADGPAPASLDVTTVLWRLGPGRYALRARFAPPSSPPPRPPARAWRGALDLPPVALTPT